MHAVEAEHAQHRAWGDDDAAADEKVEHAQHRARGDDDVAAEAQTGKTTTTTGVARARTRKTTTTIGAAVDNFLKILKIFSI